jgi:3D (Asp-Asp-Asp) domain-containing protein
MTKKTKLGLTMALVFLTVSTISITSFVEKKLELKDVKAALQCAGTKREKELAQQIEVKPNGIKYKETFIPKTDSREYKVLTVRLTVYWARGGGTDADSRRLRSSTGYTLKQGDSIAVDPRIIPYDSEVIIPNVGLVKAVDTGTAVKGKVASSGRLPVIDVFFINKTDALRFANSNPKVVKVAVLN